MVIAVIVQLLCRGCNYMLRNVFSPIVANMLQLFYTVICNIDCAVKLRNFHSIRNIIQKLF